MPANENLKEIKDQIKAKYLENKFREKKAAVRGRKKNVWNLNFMRKHRQ